MMAVSLAIYADKRHGTWVTK